MLSPLPVGIFLTTYYITVIHKALIYIYQCGLIFSFLLTMSSGCQSCVRHKAPEELSVLASQTPLGQSSLLGKQNAAKSLNNSEEEVSEASDGSHSPQLPLNKKLKRVAKVEETKQAIVFLHGLSRHSSDFDAMAKVVAKKFPHAKIIALKSVEKDSNNTEKASSPSVKLSIKKQARKAYEEITSKVSLGSHLVIVGHSQGGLRAFTLVKEHGNSLKDKMAIHRLITIGTPWKGAPVFSHIKNVEAFNKKFNKMERMLDSIRTGYSEAVRGYFFKKGPEIAKKHPKFYQNAAPWIMKWKGAEGALDLDPESAFILHDVAEGLKEFDVPITAIGTVLTDFSDLFDSFLISPYELAKLNATYAELIGGDRSCEHDMLLPISTQHGEGLTTKDFKRIKVYGACHGNKVGISVKRGLSQLNNEKVIEEVVNTIETTFYEQKEEELLEKASGGSPAA